MSSRTRGGFNSTMALVGGTPDIYRGCNSEPGPGNIVCNRY
jgi:hypothetical protein